MGFISNLVKEHDVSVDELSITKENIIASEDDAFEAAKRELREETGYTSDNWTHLLTIPANATISNSNVHIYCATDCDDVFFCYA